MKNVHLDFYQVPKNNGTYVVIANKKLPSPFYYGCYQEDFSYFTSYLLALQVNKNDNSHKMSSYDITHTFNFPFDNYERTVIETVLGIDKFNLDEETKHNIVHHTRVNKNLESKKDIERILAYR